MLFYIVYFVYDFHNKYIADILS